ncbi:von Willebrand factor type A domain-containing protein [Streptosporangiaceae bacterium NEAU-GS5]|nr:von Willebrand factor type A domain-containing protein [Streptosporangiaceae bacterium NEAU-GS5]
MSRNRAVLALAAAVTLAALATACGGSSTSSSGGDAKSAPLTTHDAIEPGPFPQGNAEARDTVPQQQTSTFALDVDTASYGYARRTIQEGRLPEPGQVRPEEFVNAFRQNYAEPEDDGFAVHVDGARLPGDEALIRVGMQTRKADAGARKPANLTFVVDVSGSMSEPGRLDLVRDALHTLVDQLMPGDQVALVTFSDDAQVITPMVSSTARSELHAAIDKLVVQGSTNLEQGLVTGYREAAKAFRSLATNRVILLSDGLANTGDTSWQAILGQATEYAGKQITLLCVGVGREYGDDLMEQLADHGDGAAVYVSSLDQARKVFVEQLPATLDLRARDAKAQVAFESSTVESYQLIGYDDRALAPEEFRDDSRDGGEVGPGHSVTALYRVRLRPGATGSLAAATVRWQDPDTREPHEQSNRVAIGDLNPAVWDGTDQRFQIDVVAAGFAEFLRARWTPGSSWLGLGLDDLSSHASALASTTEDPAVTELANLITRARALD